MKRNAIIVAMMEKHRYLKLHNFFAKKIMMAKFLLLQSLKGKAPAMLDSIRTQKFIQIQNIIYESLQKTMKSIANHISVSKDTI